MEVPEDISSNALVDFIEIGPIEFVDRMTYYHNIRNSRQRTEEGSIVTDDGLGVFMQLIHPANNLVFRVLFKIKLAIERVVKVFRLNVVMPNYISVTFNSP